MNDDDSDERQSVGNMKILDSYLIHHTSPVAFQRPNTSSSTLDALENAEKLVQEARQTIIEASYSVPTFDFTANRQSIVTDVDENELYIRDVVTAQFKKANKQISSDTIPSTEKKANVEFKSPPLVQRIVSNETIERGRVRYHEMKKKKDTCRECLMSKDDNKLRGKISMVAPLHSRNGARVDIKPQLSLRNVGRLDLFPVETNSKTKRKNVETYEFIHESSNQATTNKSLIDAAVQTNLRELSKENSGLSNELEQSSVHIVQSSSVICVDNPQTIENSAMHVGINCEEENSKERNAETSKESFLDFLCHMAGVERNEPLGNTEKNGATKNHSDGELIYSEDDDELYANFDVKQIFLDIPNTEKFDGIICDLDEKISNISKDIEKFNNEFFPMTIHCKESDCIYVELVDKNTSPIAVSEVDASPKKKINSKIQKAKDKCIDIETNVKFLLRPTSKMSSSDSMESCETMLPPARFSTPLNNYRHIDISATNIDIKKSGNKMDGYFIPITTRDMINDASKVFMTRNRFSSISSMDVNFPEIKRTVDGVNIDKNSHPISENNEEKAAENIQLNVTRTFLSSHSNEQSNRSSKSEIDNTQTNLDNIVHNEKEVEHKINMVDHFLDVTINNDNKTVTINNKEGSEYNEKDDNIENSHYSCKPIKIQCTNWNVDERSSKAANEKKSDIVILDDTNPTPPELSIRDRTSLDVSAIYSESFEASSSSGTQSKNSSNDIHENENKSEAIIQENRINSKSVDEVMDSVESIKNSIEISFHSVREKKNDKSLSQLSKSSNSNDVNSNEKIECNKSTITTSSLSNYSRRKVSSINSASSAQNSNNVKEKFTADDFYSDGELYLPSSCSYSLGEIRIVEPDHQNIIDKDNILICPTSHVSPIANSATESPGEIQETDIELNSSIEKELEK